MWNEISSHFVSLTAREVADVVVGSLCRLEDSALEEVEGAGAVAVDKPRDGEVYLGSIVAVGRAGGRPVTCSLKGQEWWLAIKAFFFTLVAQFHIGAWPYPIVLGLEYMMLWVWTTGGPGSWMLVSDWPVLSTAGSEAKSRAPNCTFSPDTSAEPGISTAEEGIWKSRRLKLLKMSVFSPIKASYISQGTTTCHL